jgi:putative transcriptional regulator
MRPIVVAMMSAMIVNAIGHEKRCGFAEFNIGRLTLSVAHFFSGAIEQEHDHGQEQEEIGRCSAAKNYRPPRPIDVKGGCSPQNNRRKLSSLVSEVAAAGKQNFAQKFSQLLAQFRVQRKLDGCRQSRNIVRRRRDPEIASERVAVSSFAMRDLGDKRVPRTLAGSLLVAHPNMLDPNFRRTVLFVSEHDAKQGALGVIINRPLDKAVAELVSGMPHTGLADVPVFLGGPVGKNQLMFAAFEWQKGAGPKLNHNITIDESRDPGGQKNLLTVCAFVGYAGWGAGQLETEVKQKAWLIKKANPSLFKVDRLPNLWFDIMRTLGPWYKMLAAAPDDPSLN